MRREDNFKMRKVGKNFASKFLDEIKLRRIQTGLDKKFISDARITEAILEDPAFPGLKERLTKIPRKENLL